MPDTASTAIKSLVPKSSGENTHSAWDWRGPSAAAATSLVAKSPLPRWIWVVSILLATAGLFTANGFLTSASVMALPFLARILWFRSEPPVLAFACVMQWLQSTLAVFRTNYYGVSLTEYGGPELTQASWLSLAGVLVLAIGIRTALWRRRSVTDQVMKESRELLPWRIFTMYLGALVTFYFLERFALTMPALSQPLLAVTSLRWAFLFLLFYSVITKQRNYTLLLVSTILELVLGVLGYFGGFKDVIFLLLVAMPLSRRFLRGKHLVTGVLVALVLICLSVVWTAIKGEYRDFLNQGTGQQVVYESVEARVLKLPELVGSLDSQALADGLDRAILRLSYVNFFAACIANVPANLPYENGALWGDAITHVLTPRFLFPDKAALDDSIQTSYYTGTEVAGAEHGTSIGLGYMAQSYVDFGPLGMFVPIFLLGVFYGVIYRFFSNTKHKILGLAIATALLIFSANKVETTCIKLLGGNLMGLIVLGLFAIVAGEWVWRFVTGRSESLPGYR
jgi:hypothetical protein